MCDMCAMSIYGYNDPRPPKTIVVVVPPRPDVHQDDASQESEEED